jgi:hypothetical protein
MHRAARIARFWCSSLCCAVLLSSSAIAEHQTFLRGIVNAPGFQVALLEIEHTLGKPGIVPPVPIKTSRLVRAGERFEDNTIKGAHFQFEVLEIDLAKETVKTREEGKEHTYSLAPPNRPESATSWLDLQNAAFDDVADIYAELENRVLLLHPAIDRTPVSLRVAWTNQPPEKAQVAEALAQHLKQQGISMVVDGAKFLQWVPSSLSLPTLPRSKDLPAGPAEIGGMTLKNTQAERLVEMYATVSKRRRTGNTRVAGSVPYLKISHSLSKAEVMYVLETLLAWNNAKVVLGEDNNFSIAQP